ncbi:MAG: endonuclease/exonuclease/phosphatase family protein [Clostridia bacterium]|nr:endonuclease/exonuclease/phosphatase family protein [Clostridia bacterium]
MKLLDLNVGIKLDNTKEVLEFIKNENADICTFQEAMNAVEDSCFDIFKSKNDIVKLENYKYNEFAPLFIAEGITKNNVIVRDFGGKAEQGSLIISKYKIIEHYNQFYYNEYKYEYDATYFREKDWCRSIQNTIIEIDGKEIQIINVHGIWNKDKIGDERTIKQSEFILNNIRKDIPVIVVGDFNLLPNTESIKALNNELVNLIEKYNIKSTRPNFNDGLDTGNIVCDYIFVNDKVKVNDFTVINTNISDHLPLILDFEIKE